MNHNKQLFHCLLVLATVFILYIVTVDSRTYELEEVGAYHIHTLFFDWKNSSVEEALSLRRELRHLIDTGVLNECSLNQIRLRDGPYPIAMYEMCCNKTSFSTAYSFMAQNHHNLSIFTHPLTRHDIIDHTQRGSWMGERVVMDLECPCWVALRPAPMPCPVYPKYSDELPPRPTESQPTPSPPNNYWPRSLNYKPGKNRY